MSWIFSEGSTFDMKNDGPSIFMPGRVAQPEISSSPDQSSGNDVEEFYVENGKSEWANDDVGSVQSSDSDAKQANDQFTYLIDGPYSGQCGDGDEDYGEDRDSCPQDAGLPDASLGNTQIGSSVTAYTEADCLYNNEGGKSKGGTYSCSASTKDRSPDRIPNRAYGNMPSELPGSLNNGEVLHITGIDTYLEKVGTITGYEKTGTSTVLQFEKGTKKSCIYYGSSKGGCDYTSCEDDKVDTYETKELEESFSLEQKQVPKNVDVWDPINYNVKTSQRSATGIFDSWEKKESETYHSQSACSTATAANDTEYTPYSVSEYDKVTDSDRSKNTRSYYYQRADYTYSTYNVNTGNGNKVGGRPANGGYRSGGGSPSDDHANSQSEAHTVYDAYTGEQKPGHSDGKVVMWPRTDTVRDASGPDGRSSAFVAIDESKGIVGNSGDLVGTETKDGFSQNYISQSDVPVPDCPGDFTKCVGVVTPYINRDTSGTIGYKYANGNPYSTSDSLGVCETYQTMSEDDDITCWYQNTDTGEDMSAPTPEGTRACGDEPGEYWGYMEGSDVNESVIEDYPAHHQGCIDQKNECVLHGENVPEGRVANVAPEYGGMQYQVGGNSPDWSACLDIDSSTPWGEWYNLDDSQAHQYLRNEGSDLVSSTNDPERIGYYWRQNDNPQHPEFNPRGEQEGVTLEDDCDPELSGCETSLPKDGLFYSFFSPGDREEDFNPQGENSEGDSHVSDAYYRGYIDRIFDDSEQLEPGMNTTVYNMAEDSDSNTVSLWNDSIGTQYRSDQWGITQDISKCVSGRGNAFETSTAGYRYDYTGPERSNPDDPTLSKLDRAMGNSLCVVSEGYFNYRGETMLNGFGVWINPDNLKQGNTSGKHSYGAYNNWTDLLDNEGFGIDMTGPDSGLGFKETSNYGSEQFTAYDNERVFVGDVKFNGSDKLDPPMCGDDESEYLLEEQGESVNPEEGQGRFICADTNAECVSYEANGGPLFERDDYAQAAEPGEESGRLKQDREVCYQRSGEEAMWFDQDYKPDLCRENILYGPQGVTWFDSSYINQHPEAVEGGIDDSWSDYFEQKGQNSLFSDPESGDYNSTHSPVDTGTKKSKVAIPNTSNYGFCGGDDDSEYIITQDCSSRFCDTNRTVIGTHKNPRGCIFDEDSTPYETNEDERKLFDPGESVTFESIQGDPKITCFDRTWYSKFPISLNSKQVSVPFGEFRTVSFQVVNTRSQKRDFKVVMEEETDTPSTYQFADLVDQPGNSFTTAVPARSSKTFQIEIFGGNKQLDFNDPGSKLFVRAEAVNSKELGSDYLKAEIRESTNSNSGQQTNEIPGITVLQIAFIFITATAVILLRN
ncbi:MAG: hypothetical protein BRC29_03070 [Nanohaloarchaea archaeon SW_7_43_1]|nr:MAG: hypothetical protein BRC29_03070 [Nanohaloarchaea archaeon SW_7_43_1]